MRKKILIVGLFLLTAVLLSGCTGATVWPGLSVLGDVAYLANTGAVHAIDMQSGQELWTFSGEGGGFLNSNPSIYVASPVLTEDGLLIVLDSGNKHIIYAVDPRDINQEQKTPTPNKKWTFREADGHWIAPPLILGNRLFAPNSDGNVYVLDMQDGQSNKQAIKVIDLPSSPEQPGRLWAQPVSDGERLFVTSLDHSLYAINLENYEILWHEDLGGAILSSPILGPDGMLYVGSFAKKLEKFDPATGQHDSVLDTKGWIWSTPVVDGDNLYFSDVEGYFYSYNTKEGRLNWDPIQLDTVDPERAITASPLVREEDVLVAVESGDIYKVSRDGQASMWHEGPDKGKIYTTPISAGGYVLVAYTESDYYLIALDQEGDKKWTFPAGK
jgi:outer membrane protein assembly factor BamB